MASFTDDNARILNSRKSQYNRNTENVKYNTSNVSTSASEKPRRTQTAVKSGEEIIAEAIARRKRYIKRRNDKFAKENSEKVRKALACGPEKVNYSYDE